MWYSIFCFKRHYSTARKIVKNIETLLANDYNRTHAAGYMGQQKYVVTLAETSNLKVMLGDVMKTQLSDELYNEYQKLSDEKKDRIRASLAEALLNAGRFVQISKKETSNTIYLSCRFVHTRHSQAAFVDQLALIRNKLAGKLIKSHGNSMSSRGK